MNADFLIGLGFALVFAAFSILCAVAVFVAPLLLVPFFAITAVGFGALSISAFQIIFEEVKK